jgi:hypothetical protein
MATPNKQKRKRQTISLIEKKAMIDASKTKTPAQLVTRFNNKYTDPTIRSILKKKSEIQEAIENEADGKRSILRSIKHSKLEEAFLKWLKEVRSENIPGNGQILIVN